MSQKRFFTVEVNTGYVCAKAYLSVVAHSEDEAREIVQERIDDEDDDWTDVDWEPDLDSLRIGFVSNNGPAADTYPSTREQQAKEKDNKEMLRAKLLALKNKVAPGTPEEARS